MRLIRRWPRLRRRVIIARRSHHKVYWYFRNFKEEFINELEASKEEKVVHEDPLYYRVCLFIRAIPAGLRDTAESWKTDYANWVTFRENSKLEFKNIRKEIHDLHSDNKKDYHMWFSIVVRLFRDSLKSFLQGYNEAIAGKPFPSEEVIKAAEYKEQKNSTPDVEKDRNSAENNK